jgi:hypothetical protein
MERLVMRIFLRSLTVIVVALLVAALTSTGGVTSPATALGEWALTLEAKAAALAGRAVTTAAAAAPVVPPSASSRASAPSASPSSAVGAIKAVILKANQEQQTALAQNNPAVMLDTATTAYYQQVAQINQDLLANGVTAIRLVHLQWGRVTLQSATTAQAITYETWQTRFANGATEQSTDRNVYQLVLAQGSWKIQTDAHPDTNLDQPGASTAPTLPVLPVAPTSPSVPVSPGVGIAPSTNNTSRNWSGYAASGGTYTAVTGTWTVPQAQGTSSTGERNLATGATWVGIGGVTSHDLIQAGTEDTVTGSGQAQYDAWIEMLPQASHPIPLSISPGDSVTVTIDNQGGNQWQIAFKDNTSGQTYQTSVQYASSESSAEWIEEAPSAGRTLLPLDNFGTVQFTNASTVKNGATDTLSQAGAQPITMINAYGSAVASPSALNRAGNGFSITRSNASTTPSVGPGRRGFGGYPGSSGYSGDPGDQVIPFYPGRSGRSSSGRTPWWISGSSY